MEAAPRLPMFYFDLKVCTENTRFAPQLKQYIAAFYNEDPDSYLTEIHNLETLRSAAVRPSMDVNGVQLLKKYYCQLHFLKSRFPMEENQDAAVQFLWKDNQTGMNCGGSDIRFELMVIMYNIGALHSYLGATDSRSNPDGMKMACTHFQCAAWAFQTVKEKYHQFIIYISSVELVHFYQQVCLAQAQECILEKSMLDNRKATIIAKVAVQVYNYYRQSWTILNSTNDEIVGSKTYKEWIKYLEFKIAYHRCIALLFQGQQAEEQQKMGERVAFYQAACEQLEEARKLSTALKHRQQEINESLAFTLDVVEGKRKAAKNENEFIYHEEVPDKDHLQEVKGASLVKGIPFSVNDTEVSGSDIFARLVPMEAHEAASLYSEKKAQMLRQIGELVENKDQSLAEFMSSMQLDLLTKMNQATGIPQELIDRAAALSAKPTATQDLVDIMGKLSNIYQEVESNLNEIEGLLKQEEEAEKGYQELMGKRPPGIIATDLAREAAKYKEAHTKANDSNQTLHRAMMAHVANLKILQQPLRQLQQQLPSVELPNANIDEATLKDLETLVAKVEEMRTQRAMLWAQFREGVHKDDITNSLVTKQPNQSLEQLFQQELQKHQQLVGLIEQNCTAQENIKKALVDCYAKAVNTRRYVQEVIQKRNSTISALITSYDSYEDLLAKANKGIEFYTKLETNVSKLLQRIRSACEVQREEREQMLSKSDAGKTDDTAAVAPVAPASTAPKLKDYLESRKKNAGVAGGYPDPSLQYQQQVQYHSLQYATSVQPNQTNYSYNSTYSSPNFNTSSAKAGEDKHMATGLNAATSQAQTNYSATVASQPQYINQQSYTPSGTPTLQQTGSMAAARQTYSPYQNQQIHSSDSVPSVSYPATGTQPTYPPSATQQTYPTSVTQSSYPTSATQSTYPASATQLNYPASATQQTYPPSATQQTYSPSATQQTYPPPDTQSTYPASATHQTYPTSATQPTYPASDLYQNGPSSSYGTGTHLSYQTHSTVSKDALHSYPSEAQHSYYPTEAHQGYSNPNTPQLYQTGSGSSIADQNAGAVGYSSYYPQAYTQYTASQAQVGQQAATPTANKTKESNVDLLSGLDFTISQAPLIPQQNVASKSETGEVKPSDASESKTNVSKPVPPKEERPALPEIKRLNVKILPSKQLNNNDVKCLFMQEIEKYEKYVETLTNKTLSGPTNLDIKWKEIQDKQDAEGQKKIISVARCYPMKNRFPDILPYDYSRVELHGTKDDYINASYIYDVSPYAPSFIVTQTPTSSTSGDFWTMIREQQVELIFCVSNDTEIGQDVYWPKEKGQHLNVLNMVISLQSVIVKSHWIERLISVNLPEKRESWVVMHLQFTSWPGSLFPTSPEPFIAYVLELITLYQQQRCATHPVVVHCTSGIGKSGLACLLTAAIYDVTNNSNSVPDLACLASKLTNCRKNILRDREHLKFAYEAFLSYMKQIVNQERMKKRLNEMVPKQQEEAKQPLEVAEKNEDPLSSLDPFWASKK
ncbi:tyrosine-protein phosphatase non-receptor type 23 isoform X2 [Anoplophora glabripennis]|uniref:tyrosine-protein phosphatase non-receptor type 23 isoform X2 n=1 Tax=Anoplophora glabripennis TaxID=217634 RepID=UPI000873AE71|nr:tyrosine-protein phosphatase non-receptor type 23 isoform X2 [Anoplophora glabripennis]